MVNLLEVPLLHQLIVGRAALLGNDSSLIYLVLQGSQDVRQLDVLPVDLGNLWHLV